MFSCFYLAISLFLSHLVINDILTNVVESSTVTDALVDSCKDAFKTLNVDEDKARSCYFYSTRSYNPKTH